jgi:hypothetical protein
MYTIHRADGERDLVLEHGLAGLESQFVAIRDAKLAREQEITIQEHLMLAPSSRRRRPGRRLSETISPGSGRKFSK